MENISNDQLQLLLGHLCTKIDELTRRVEASEEAMKAYIDSRFDEVWPQAREAAQGEHRAEPEQEWSES